MSLLEFIKDHGGLRFDQIVGKWGFETGISPLSIKNYLKVLINAGVVVTRGWYGEEEYYYKDDPKLNNS